MDESRDTSDDTKRTASSTFLRVGTTAAAACLIAGSIAGLGAMGALASPSSSYAEVSASGDTSSPDPKAAAPEYTDADRAAFAASPYAEDALNLAAIWGTDTEWAEGKAGSKIQAGIPLPFAAGEAMSFAYTPDQKRLALQLTTVDMSGIVRVAAVWSSADLYSAKADMGALLLAHQPLPAMPAAFSDDNKVRAFGFSGYTDDDAVKLAGLWQTDTYSAILRAGAEVLAGHELPL